jgi:hypothetical protein
MSCLLRDVAGAIADMRRAAELFTSQDEPARAQEALDAARDFAD